MANGGPVTDAMRLGDCATVLELPAKHPIEQLAHGKCHLQNEQWAQAVEVTAVLGEGVIGDYARWIEAQAYLEQQEPLKAYDALKSLELPGDLRWTVQLARGQSLVLAGRSLDAREGLRSLLETSVGIEARYWLARGGQDRGEKEAAIATYRRVWTTGVRGQWDERAAERLKELGAPVPDPHSELGLKLIRARMAVLQKERQYMDVLQLLETIHQADPPDTDAEKLEHARAIFKARKYPESVTAFNTSLGPADSAKGSAGDLFNYGLAYARTGDYDKAMTVYGRLIRLYPSTGRADFGSFKRGYTEYDRRNFKTAIPEFERHIKDRPKSKYLDEAIWFLGLCHWLNDNRKQATAVWSTLPQRRPKSALVPAAKYWLARAKGLDGDLAGEQAGYKALLSSHPTAGHTWYAAHRLGHSFPQKVRKTPPEWPESLRNRDEVKRSEVLFHGGFLAWARNEMKSLEDVAKAQGKQARLAAAWRFIATGDYRTGQQLARPYCVRPWKGGDPLAQQACHPMPEAPVVERVVKQYDVNPFLPYGVMIAESALKPWVTSHAGARGLMQLMPEVGERLARELYPDKAFHPDQLYSATLNATLGTTELGQRTQSLQNTLSETSLPAIIASYNGGEPAVRRWISMFDETPEFDIYAETIGYAETRRYIRRVLGYIMIYRWTYGDP